MANPEALADVGSAAPTQIARPPLPGGPFLVVGLGRAGRAAALALGEAVGPDMVRAWDVDTGARMRRLRRELETRGIQTRLGPKPTRRDVSWARTVVKSPGVAFETSVIQRARGKGREVLDELELGWRLSRAPLIAVTGTNGKSTVSGLATAVLSAAGRRTALAGNTEFGPSLSAVGSEALDWIVCEVSSYQLEGCTDMLPELGVFTNLTPEHLGRHRTLERYGAIKRRLFVNHGRAAPRAIVDVDGPFARDLAATIEQRGGVVTRVGTSATADYRVESSAWSLRRAETRLRTPAGPVFLVTALPGAYNARNVAAALAIADITGVARRISVPALSSFAGPPGRFEHIDEGQPFELIVDFAHTPDALEQLLATIRAGMEPDAGLIVVLGRGGPHGSAMEELGELARRMSDRLILTTSGFRGAPPMLTLGSNLAGARREQGGELEIVLDRRRAIERAVLRAGPGDVVVIPGRGALPEQSPDPHGRPIPFDDRRVAREVVRAAVVNSAL